MLIEESSNCMLDRSEATQPESAFEAILTYSALLVPMFIQLFFANICFPTFTSCGRDVKFNKHSETLT